LTDPAPVARLAADCHAHVFGGDGYPCSPDTVYEPHPAQAGTAAEFLAVLDAHGMMHGLPVGAGPYGPDNRCLLDALAAAPARFEGIALVSAAVSERELAHLADAGVVGIRFNLSAHGMGQLHEPGANRLLARVREIVDRDRTARVARTWSLRAWRGRPRSPAASPAG
jgi:predicted TIM-barrel fold metal-dependent hydrolase